MNMTAAWFGAGAVSAVVHTVMLWRDARSSPGHLMFAPVRFFVIGAVLLVGAMMGYVLTTAGGWAVGLVTSALLLLRWRRQ